MYEAQISACKAYLKAIPEDSYVSDKLKMYTFADAVGFIIGRWTKIDYGFLTLNPQMKVGSGYRLTNSKTHYEFTGEPIVIWNESCGRLAFLSEGYYGIIDDEWEAFLDEIESYEPLDQDRLNNTFIFSTENGKNLMLNYEDMKRRFYAATEAKIAAHKAEKKRAQIRKLQEELNDFESEYGQYREN